MQVSIFYVQSLLVYVQVSLICEVSICIYVEVSTSSPFFAVQIGCVVLSSGSFQVITFFKDISPFIVLPPSVGFASFLHPSVILVRGKIPSCPQPLSTNTRMMRSDSVESAS